MSTVVFRARRSDYDSKQVVLELYPSPAYGDVPSGTWFLDADAAHSLADELSTAIAWLLDEATME